MAFTLDNYTKITFNLILGISFIAFIVGFRYKVGADWEGYKLYFETGNFEEGKIEFGFRFINQLIFYLKGKYSYTFFIISFISWYFIFKSYPKQFLPLGIYFLFCDEWFFFSTNGVRQFVAFGFFLYATKFLTNRNFKQYILWIFIAGLFHRTAWLLFPLCLMPWGKLNNRNIWLVIYSVSFIFTQDKIILGIFPTLFNRLTDYIQIFNFYSSYFDTSNYEAVQVSFKNYGVVFRILITFFIIYFSKEVLDKYPKALIYYVIYFIGAIITNVFIGIPIVSRFAIYFTIFRPFLLALTVYYILRKQDSEISKLFSVAVIMSYFILFLYVISISPYDFTFLH